MMASPRVHFQAISSSIPPGPMSKEFGVLSTRVLRSNSGRQPKAAAVAVFFWNLLDSLDQQLGRLPIRGTEDFVR